MMSVEYVAGFFDGEGSVGVYSRSRSPGRYYASFGIAGNYHPGMVALCKALPGAKLYERKVKPTHRGAYALRIYKAADISAALEWIHPHLWEKRAQASIVLDFLHGRVDGACANALCSKLKKISFENGIATL